MRKHIECHARENNLYNPRKVIAELLELLDDTYDALENGNLELDDQMDIIIRGKAAHINYYCPNTWEYAEVFLMQTIGFLIMCYELREFPYYEKLLKRMTNALGCDAEDLDVL